MKSQNPRDLYIQQLPGYKWWVKLKSVLLPACLPACMYACLSVCVTAFLPVCMPWYPCLPLHACLPAWLFAFFPVCLPACFPACLPICRLVNLPTISVLIIVTDVYLLYGCVWFSVNHCVYVWSSNITVIKIPQAARVDSIWYHFFNGLCLNSCHQDLLCHRCYAIIGTQWLLTLL